MEPPRPEFLGELFSREALSRPGERLNKCRRDLLRLAKYAALAALGGAVGLLIWILIY